jgi:hypothetical protein
VGLSFFNPKNAAKKEPPGLTFSLKYAIAKSNPHE